MRYRTRVTAPAAAAALALTAPAAPAAARTGPAAYPGGESAGDPVYPTLGNRGYRVRAYDLDLRYDPVRRLVDARAELSIEATEDPARFSLDCLGLTIHRITVDGRPVGFELGGGDAAEKLRIAAPLRPGARLTVRIDYTADPRRTLPHTGWVPTPDGFAAAAQPRSAHTVFPCNDHPSDKAYFTFRITVPDGLLGVANGTLVGTRREGDRTTYTYRSRDPIATELVQLSVGAYLMTNRQGPGGLPLRDVVPTARAAELEPALALTPGLLRWLEARLGPFPFETYGLLPCNTDDPDAFAFTGLETQTLTLYKPGFLRQPEHLIGSHLMHELTHSWFGNSVSPARWSDLWLNEGHADYYGLLYRYERGWVDAGGRTTMEARMQDTYAQADQWRHDWGPVATPEAADLFTPQRYLGGVLALYALRQLVGDAAFGRIERAFLDRYRSASATTADYIDTASELAGQDLTGFLTDWLYGTRTPRMPGHPDWTVRPVGAGERLSRAGGDPSATLGCGATAC